MRYLVPLVVEPSQRFCDVAPDPFEVSGGTCVSPTSPVQSNQTLTPVRRSPSKPGGAACGPLLPSRLGPDTCGS